MNSFPTLFAVVNLAVLGTLLLFKKSSPLPTKLLGWAVILPATPFLVNYFLLIDIIPRYPFLVFLSFNMLWAPSVALYVRLLLEERVSFHYRQWPHLLPYFFHLVASVIFCSQDFHERKRLCDNVFNGQFPWLLLLLNFTLLLQSLGYLSYCFFKVRGQVKQKKEAGLPLENSLKWAREFVCILFGLNVIVIAMSLVLPQQEVVYYYIPLFYMSVYYLILYEAIRYSATFTGQHFQLQFASVEPAPVPYRSSGLSEELVNELESKLLLHMQNQKPYLDPELSIQELAQQLDTTLHKLSQVLNQKVGSSFTDYVNRYRIEESKKMLLDASKSLYSIDGIGFECGFNSKSTFYKAFKKQTGSTPSYFKQANSLSA